MARVLLGEGRTDEAFDFPRPATGERESPMAGRRTR